MTSHPFSHGGPTNLEITIITARYVQASTGTPPHDLRFILVRFMQGRSNLGPQLQLFPTHQRHSSTAKACKSSTATASQQGRRQANTVNRLSD